MHTYSQCLPSDTYSEYHIIIILNTVLLSSEYTVLYCTVGKHQLIMNEEANDCSFETASHATRTTFLSLFEFLNGLFVLFALVPTILKK